MALKQEIETWVSALGQYDNNEFDEALKTFETIADTSRILFNCGVINATLGQHDKAISCYQRAVDLDMYLAVAYFQQGVSNFLVGDFEEALANFNDTLLYLRGNNNIDYEQLGLKFKLYSCEVLFNRGLCYIYLQQRDVGMQDLSYAAKEKVVPDHDVIDEAIAEEAEGYTVFSIPVGIVYRPNEAKVRNLKTKNYLGQAKLVAATDRANAFTGFAGAEIKRMNQEAGAAAKDDRPEDKLSYAATNLVKPGLSSRARQQSEPPMNRNMFPPTPPPENDKPGGPERKPSSAAGSASTASQDPMSRAASVRGGGPKPLNFGGSNAGGSAYDLGEYNRPRAGNQRSMSERPRPSRDYSMSRRGTERNVPRRRMIEEEDEEDEYADDLYDMYQQPPRRPSYAASQRNRSQSRPGAPRRRPTYIDEDLEEEDEYYSEDDADFEMVQPARSVRSRGGPMGSRRSPRAAPSVLSSASGGSRRGGGGGGGGGGDRVKVKVHAEDTRFVLVEQGKSFRDFVAQIRDKFGLRQNFKVMIREDGDGDMITMSDQDDLDLAIDTAMEAAGGKMGKMEVWVQEA